MIQVLRSTAVHAVWRGARDIRPQYPVTVEATHVQLAVYKLHICQKRVLL
jgi:hypothetical protein